MVHHGPLLFATFWEWLAWLAIDFHKSADDLQYTPEDQHASMEPENTPLEKEHHLPNHHFQVLLLEESPAPPGMYKNPAICK